MNYLKPNDTDANDNVKLRIIVINHVSWDQFSSSKTSILGD